MDKVFMVEIFRKNLAVDLWLPATDYQLLDAIGKLGIHNNASPSVDIYRYEDKFQNLSDVMEKDNLNLFELNALAERLSRFELEDEIAFHALVLTRMEREDGNIPTQELLDLAYSTECCDVYLEVETYEELGHFYVENDMVPELMSIPEEALPFLNYGQIGRKFSEAECGMLVPGGYVTQTSDLKEVSKSMEFAPPKPNYTILLDLEQEGMSVKLPLPTQSVEMDRTLRSINSLGWFDPLLQVVCLDCAVPSLIPILGGSDDPDELNQLAWSISQMGPTQLNKYKAVLEATEEKSLLGAIQILGTLDEYVFNPQFIYPEDMAQDFLASRMGVKASDTLSKFVNLYGYGEVLMKEQNCVQTEYGMLSREDGQCLRLPVSPEQSIPDEMTMQ